MLNCFKRNVGSYRVKNMRHISGKSSGGPPTYPIRVVVATTTDQEANYLQTVEYVL